MSEKYLAPYVCSIWFYPPMARSEIPITFKIFSFASCFKSQYYSLQLANKNDHFASFRGDVVLAFSKVKTPRSRSLSKCNRLFLVTVPTVTNSSWKFTHKFWANPARKLVHTQTDKLVARAVSAYFQLGTLPALESWGRVSEPPWPPPISPPYLPSRSPGGIIVVFGGRPKYNCEAPCLIFKRK